MFHTQVQNYIRRYETSYQGEKIKKPASDAISFHVNHNILGYFLCDFRVLLSQTGSENKNISTTVKKSVKLMV
jgi:hypothetical protein